MKNENFPEANCKIGFEQEEYQGLHAHKELLPKFPGALQYTMCFELDENERKQVAETGRIWIKRLQPVDALFHPIGPDVLKPESFQNVYEVNKVEDFNPDTFDIKTVDLNKVDYFYKKAAMDHLELEADGKSEEVFTKVLADAQKKALKQNE